jgi:hypothetical protein
VNPIECRLTLRDASPGGFGQCGPATFRYDPAAPYEVALVFGDDNVWTFARDLLADGLIAATGDGDVRVWPERLGQATAAAMIRLTSPDGMALLEAPYGLVAGFVVQVYERVRRGRESVFMDLDAGLTGFLAGGKP